MSKWILAAVLIVFPAFAEQQKSRIFTGVITDTMCELNHAAMKTGPDAKCIVECVKASKTYKYALHDGKAMYVLSDQQTPEKFAGRKVSVKGVLYAKTGIIKVESIAAAR